MLMYRLLFTLVLYVVVVIVINANIVHISLIGFGNFPCSHFNGNNLLWYSSLDQNNSRNFYECEHLSPRYKQTYPRAIHELQQKIKDYLTINVTNPVIICAVLGETLWPKLKWIINSPEKTTVMDRKEFFKFDNLFIVVSYLPVFESFSDFYECKIDVPQICTRDNHPAKLAKLSYSNFDSSNNTVYRKSETRTKKPEKPKYTLPIGECRIVPSKFCEPIDQNTNSVNRRQVYVMNKFNTSLRDVEKQLKINFTDLLRSSKSMCYKRLKEFACFYLFPMCASSSSVFGENDGQKRYLPVCKEHCNRLSLIECKDQIVAWPIIEKRFMQILKSFDVDWIGCSNLPAISKSSDNCWTSLFQQKWETAKRRVDCFQISDRHYVGRLSRTTKGFHCQRWDSLCPHDHDYWPEFYPELYKAENYCRNPDGKRYMPWCYTNVSTHIWDYCPLPMCPPTSFSDSLSNRVTNSGADFKNKKKEKSPVLIIVVATLGFLCCVTCAVVCYVYYRRRYANFSQRHSSRDENCQSPGENEYGLQMFDIQWSQQYEDPFFGGLHDNAIYHRLITDTDIFGRLDNDVVEKLRMLEFPRNDIVHIRTLSKGHDKIVYLAKAQETSPCINGAFLPKTFVVKSLTWDSSADHVTDICMEALSLLTICRHENIVELLAICFHGRPECILLEFMPCGDLRHFLQNCATSTLNYDEQDADNSSSRCSLKLTETDLWSMATQIAYGMVHVHRDLGFVHRDLAARNCLVGAGLKVKISDFGMCRKLTENFYQGDFAEEIPVRWAPPEVHRDRLFSVRSDVWSFGVLLWEMCTFGMQPYFGLSNVEVSRFVCSENKLTQPHIASDDLYALMLKCWDDFPLNRPDFVEIYGRLKNDMC